MRPGILPQPDQSFGFRERELVVRPELMVHDIPRVEVLNCVSMTANYRTSDGVETNLEHHGAYWGRDLFPGDRVMNIDTGTGSICYTFVDDDLEPHCTGRVERRELTKDDLLIVRARSLHEGGQARTLLSPAIEPLPGGRGRVSYQLLGVIAPDDSLLSFGLQGQTAQRMIDLCLAMQYADTPQDALVLVEEWGVNVSLLWSIGRNDLVSTYLGYWRDKRGEDYMPSQEPRNLFEEVGQPSPDMKERYANPGHIALIEWVAR